MKRIAKLAAVLVAVGAATLPAPVSAAPVRNTGTIVVHRMNYTQEYRQVMTACVGRDQSWNRFEVCAQLHPDNGARCLTVEEWYDTTPETFRVVRDEC